MTKHNQIKLWATEILCLNEMDIPLFQKFVYLLPELFFYIEIPDEVMMKYGLHSS